MASNFQSSILRRLPTISRYEIPLASSGVIAAFLLAQAAYVEAQCESFGNDIVDGGFYYFNLISGAPFSFNGSFTGQLNIFKRDTAYVIADIPSSGCIAETCTASITLLMGPPSLVDLSPQLQLLMSLPGEFRLISLPCLGGLHKHHFPELSSFC